MPTAQSVQTLYFISSWNRIVIIIMTTFFKFITHSMKFIQTAAAAQEQWRQEMARTGWNLLNAREISNVRSGLGVYNENMFFLFFFTCL